MSNQQRITYLVKVALERTASPDELLELTNLLKHDTGEITAQIEVLLKEYETTERPVLTAPAIEDMAGAVLQADRGAKQEEEAKIKVISLWKRIAVAASVILMLATGTYFLFINKPQQQTAKTEIQQQRFKNDVAAPQTNKAVLTLSDGSTIVLDSAVNGSLAVQGNVNVVKLADGQIVYKGDATEVKYNTLTVPKGSKPVQLQLADGSEVWLNVASSITYPTAFAGNERKVKMTGEAYFDVAHYAVPFIVQKGDASVQVLGTHFNVNSYDDEDAFKITLLEGSVKVSNRQSSIVIKPGQQAQIENPGNPLIPKIMVQTVDVDEAIAWKEGQFNFKSTNITAIMRQVSRWYNVDVEYKGDVSAIDFSGIISRKENVSRLLNVLEETGTVHFKIENKKIVVTP